MYFTWILPFLKKSLSLGEDALHVLGLCYQRKERFDLAILYYEKELDEKREENLGLTREKYSEKKSSEEIARIALYKASAKLPIKTRFIKRF